MTAVKTVNLDEISMEELDAITNDEAQVAVNEVESNTDWQNTEKHMMRNGHKMNC